MEQREEKTKFVEEGTGESRQSALKRMRKWLKAGRRKAIILLCAAVLLLTGTALALGASSPLDGKITGPAIEEDPSTEIDVDPVDNYFLVDKEQYSDVLLDKTDDAGTAYLNDTLFIGDSNTLRINMFGMLTLQNVIGVEGMGVVGAVNNNCVYFQNMANPVTIAEAVKMLKPRRMIVCYGTNDLGGLAIESFIKNYKTFIAGLQESYEYADIIVAAVPPFDKSIERGNFKIKMVTEFNLALIDMCEELGLKFLDTGEALTATDGYIKPEYIYSDGLHLNEKGLEALLKYVRTHVYETQDRRPKPLGTIPKRRPAPYVPPPEEEVFDPSAVTGGVLAMLQSDGFTLADEQTDMTDAVYATYRASIEMEPGSEGDVAAALYARFMELGYSSGTVSAGYVTSGEEYVFSVGVVPDGGASHEHTFGAWTVIKEPNCTQAGERRRSCTVQGCTHAETEALPALGHSWGEWSGTGASCIAAANQSRTCTRCGAVEADTTPALGHDFSAGGPTCSRCAEPNPGYVAPVEPPEPPDPGDGGGT